MNDTRDRDMEYRQYGVTIAEQVMVALDVMRELNTVGEPDVEMEQVLAQVWDSVMLLAGAAAHGPATRRQVAQSVLDAMGMPEEAQSDD